MDMIFLFSYFLHLLFNNCRQAVITQQ